jgi:hypothetical protein
VKRVLPIAALALAGCQTTASEPVVEVREVPVPVTCVAADQIPAEPPTVGQRFNGDAKHDLGILAPNAQALRKWGQDLRALLEGCTGETEPAAAEGGKS